jgi:diguanylate cyclase (GGDEF)-like protein
MIDTPIANCKTAELHLIDRVQSFGALITIDKRTRRIGGCSANIGEFMDREPAALLGEDWSAAFRADQVPGLFQPGDPGWQHLARIQGADLDGNLVTLAWHSLGATTMVEIEAFEAEQHPFGVGERVAYLHALAATDTPESAADLLMDTVARICRYDRVMLYKFLPDWHGEVIAERLKPGIHGYLGLRFPASDIPANARRLYLVNWQRVIADVHAPTVPVMTLPGGDPIDFTFSQLRSVHPVHVEYLKNIGVEAAFSVSLMVGGNLWGLVACHNLSAKSVSMTHRQLCEELARTTAMHMGDMTALQRAEHRAGFSEGLAGVLGALRSQHGKRAAIVSQLPPIREVFRAQGILAHIDGQDFHNGLVPDEISLSALRNWVENYDKSSVAVSRTIAPALAAYPALVRFASGTLYIPLSGEDFLLLMRPEEVETVNWAGKPADLTGGADSITAMTPRASFQKWSQQVKGCSQPWDDAEIEAAARLRELLIDHVEKLLLENAALHDPLTGLANRLMFEKSIQEAINLAIKEGILAAVFMLDLDKFKPVNDTLGHAGGDELLIEVGRRLTGLVRARDLVARLGGDEFGIVQFDVQRTADAERTAARILEEIHRPFVIQGQHIEVGVSIGFSMCPIHAIEHHELVETADLALFEAKRAGRNTFKSFTDDMMADNLQRESVRDGLLSAMRDHSMQLVFQPIVGSKTRALRSFEAFARWEHPAKGGLAAREFLPLIEQCQLLGQFADWGIRQVLEQGKLWMRRALPLVPVSLNLTARQFLSLDLAGTCRTLSRELDVSLEWLRFDLDETALQIDLSRAAEKINALAQLGILVNIDHFGQGLVPLNRIGEVRINKLKVLGKYFDSPDSARNDALLAIIREVGRVLHSPIVATQLETPAMLARATSAGVEYLQGNIVTRALPPDAAEQWLKGRIAPP